MEQLKRNGAFFVLLRAGLWEQDVRLLNTPINFNALYRLAERQSVVGLMAAGLEHVIDVKVPKNESLAFAGETLQIEQRNKAMNNFIGVLFDKLRKEGLTPILVKGSGVAQCYMRPLWRSCGDIDLLLTKQDYFKATELLLEISSSSNPERKYSMHKGIIIEPWYVELHGTFRTGLSERVDKRIDSIIKQTFERQLFRTWDNGGVNVVLPEVNYDIILIFTHFIMHFYREVIVVRQVCDLCMLLYTHIDSIDFEKLEERLESMGLVSEWKAFASLAVMFLGFPESKMPLYDGKYDNRFMDRFIHYVMFCGEKSKLMRIISLFRLFPNNTLRFLPSILLNVNSLKVKERIFQN